MEDERRKRKRLESGGMSGELKIESWSQAGVTQAMWRKVNVIGEKGGEAVNCVRALVCVCVSACPSELLRPAMRVCGLVCRRDA